MISDIELVNSILKPRVSHEFLAGIYEVIFDADKKKFHAFTYLPLIRRDFDEISYLFNNLSHSSYADTEKTRKYLTEDKDTWQYKTTEECIDEKIYACYSFRFTGMLYEGEWFITKGLTYFGPEINEEEAKRILKFHGHEFDYWNSYPFIPEQPLFLKEKPLFRDIVKEEFKLLPEIVAAIKRDKKEEVNRAFRRYMNEEIFIPFSEKLKIKDPYKYCSYCHMYSEDFELIFPQHKKYVMMVAIPKDEKGQYRIEYFVYSEEQFLLQWNFPGEHLLKSCHSYFEDIIQDFAKVSDWNDWKFINSSRTLDDDNFWNECVFKKENDEYVFLSRLAL